MNIDIKRNTFVQHEHSRSDVVQKICDVIIRELDSDSNNFKIEISGIIHPHLFLAESKNNQRAYICQVKQCDSHYDNTMIRSCEMRLAVRLIQEAGYYVMRSSGGWAYDFSNRPYFCLEKAEYTDFTAFID